MHTYPHETDTCHNNNMNNDMKSSVQYNHLHHEMESLQVLLVDDFQWAEEAQSGGRRLMILVGETSGKNSRDVFQSASALEENGAQLVTLTKESCHSLGLADPDLVVIIRISDEKLDGIHLDACMFQSSKDGSGTSDSICSVSHMNHLRTRLTNLLTTLVTSSVQVNVSTSIHFSFSSLSNMSSLQRHLCLPCLRAYSSKNALLEHASDVHNLLSSKAFFPINEGSNLLLILTSVESSTCVYSLTSIDASQQETKSEKPAQNGVHSAVSSPDAPDSVSPEPQAGAMEDMDDEEEAPDTRPEDSENENSCESSRPVSEDQATPSAMPATSLANIAALMGLQTNFPAAPCFAGVPQLNQNQLNFYLQMAATHAANANNGLHKSPFEEQSLVNTTASPVLSNHCSRNSNKTIKCPHCNWHYKYQETLEIHMRDKHPEYSAGGSNGTNPGGPAGQAACCFCQTKQPHPRLSRGETYSCGYKPYRCEVCNYSTTTKGNLSIHIQSDKHINNMAEHNQNIEMNRLAGANTEVSGLRAHTLQQSIVGLSSQTGTSSSKTKVKESAISSPAASTPATGSIDENSPPAISQAQAPLQGHPQVPDTIVPSVNTAFRVPHHNSIHNVDHSSLSIPTNYPPTSCDRIFICNICLVFGSNALDDIQSHSTQQRPPHANDQADTMVYHEGYWHCRLCSYKSNLKANFQLHCKTDKHLQRQQLLTHVREGGPNNEVRFSTLSAASPVQVRCNACNFFTTSVHKLRIHTSTARHEMAAALFHAVTERERVLDLTGAIGVRSNAVYECRPCQAGFATKVELMGHLQVDEHEARYSAMQMQYQSQQQIMELGHIVNVRSSRTPEGHGEQESKAKETPPIPCETCPLCKSFTFRDEGEIQRHMEQEHKIPSDMIGKCMKLVYEEQASSSFSSNTVRKTNKITTNPKDGSADALLLSLAYADGSSTDDGIYRCHACPASFPTPDSLFQHQAARSHQEKLSGPPFLCFKRGCNQYFGSYEIVKMHALQIHAKGDFLEVTNSTKGTDFSFVCTVCYLVAFRTDRALGDHVKVHEGQSVFTCTLCAQLCTSMAELKRHISREHCQGESKSGDGNSLLNQPVPRIAAGPLSGSSSSEDSSKASSRRFRCYVCNLSFHKQTQLAAHTRSHTHRRMALENEETANSRHAFNSTMQPGQSALMGLQQNVSAHPYRCNVCNIGFQQKEAFGQHCMTNEHLTYMANISRLVQEGKMEANRMLLETPQMPTSTAAMPVPVFNEPSVSAAPRLPQLPLFPGGHHLLSQHFLPHIFSRLPFAPTLPLFGVRPPVSVSGFPGTTCPKCGQYIAGPEALSQHPCYINATSAASKTSTSSITTETTQLSKERNEAATAPENESAWQKQASKRFLEKTGLDNGKLFLGNYQNGKHYLKSEVEDLSLSGEKTNVDAIDNESSQEFVCHHCNEIFDEGSLLKLHYERDHGEILSSDVVQSFDGNETSEQAIGNQSHQESVDMDDELRPLQICTEDISETSRADSSDDAANKSNVTSIDHSTVSTPSNPNVVKTSTMATPLGGSPKVSTSLSIPGVGMLPVLPGSAFGALQSSLGFPVSLLNQAATSGSATPVHFSGRRFSTPSSSSVSVSEAGQDPAKRGRTRINDEQLKVLRSYFDISNSPSDSQIDQMVHRTGLQSRVIKHWFRNTLFKERQRNKNSPYNFSVPPSTSLNLEEYEKTGRVEIKESPEAKIEPILDFVEELDARNFQLPDQLMAIPPHLPDHSNEVTDVDQNKNVTKMESDLPDEEDYPDAKGECLSVGNSPTSSISVSESGASEGVESRGMKRKVREDEDDEQPSTKRQRTTISPEQQDILLGYYQKDPNPSRKQMDFISNQVDLSKRVVQVWFQNTRSRDRKGQLKTTHFSPICKLCPYCKVLFRVRSALETHLVTCHPEQWVQGLMSVDSIPTESEAPSSDANSFSPNSRPPVSQPPMSQLPPQVQQPFGDVGESPLDLSRSTAPVGLDTDDSLIIEWDEESPEHSTSGSLNDCGNKRNRTNIHTVQLKVMKSIYLHYKTPTNTECVNLGQTIGLTRRVVQVWFQNQRAKEKKQIRESGRPQPASKSAKNFLLGEASSPKGCELCNVVFNAPDNLQIQDHLFSSMHIDRLYHRILNEESGDIVRSLMPSTTANTNTMVGNCSMTSSSTAMPMLFPPCTSQGGLPPYMLNMGLGPQIAWQIPQANIESETN